MVHDCASQEPLSVCWSAYDELSFLLGCKTARGGPTPSCLPATSYSVAVTSSAAVSESTAIIHLFSPPEAEAGVFGWTIHPLSTLSCIETSHTDHKQIQSYQHNNININTIYRP